MPNWLYLLFHFLYAIGLSIWIGGALVLGVLTAPALFRSLPREQAGAIFGPMLVRFARLRLAGCVMIILGAGVQFWRWETHVASPWLVLRWLAIAALTATVVYELLVLYPAIAARGPSFERLHKRSEMLMKASLVAAMVAIFFS